MVPLPYSQGRSTRYSDRLHDFPVTIPRYYNDLYVNSFFPLTARLWNSLPIECFPLTFDLNGFKCRNNRHLNCRSFLKRFPVSLNPFVLLFLVTSCLLVAVQPYMEGILKKRVVLVVFNKIYFLHICLTSFLFESKFFSFPICHSFSICLIIVLSIVQTLMIIIVTISGIIFAVTDVLVLLLSVLFLLYISWLAIIYFFRFCHDHHYCYCFCFFFFFFVFLILIKHLLSSYKTVKVSKLLCFFCFLSWNHMVKIHNIIVFL